MRGSRNKLKEVTAKYYELQTTANFILEESPHPGVKSFHNRFNPGSVEWQKPNKTGQHGVSWVDKSRYCFLILKWKVIYYHFWVPWDLDDAARNVMNDEAWGYVFYLICIQSLLFCFVEQFNYSCIISCPNFVFCNPFYCFTLRFSASAMGPFSEFLLSLAKEESHHYNIDLMSGMFVLTVRALNINSSCTFI